PPILAILVVVESFCSLSESCPVSFVIILNILFNKLSCFSTLDSKLSTKLLSSFSLEDESGLARLLLSLTIVVSCFLISDKSFCEDVCVLLFGSCIEPPFLVPP
ncbi:hypothetical protein GLOIN_2v1686534, partial [Rhizophagus irregularis DAOM 181602=DAOM 197198]